MEKTATAALALILLAACAGTAAGQGASGVTAVRSSYTAALSAWDLWAVRAYCATWDAGMPLAWRQRYDWAAFCGPAGPRGTASCGRCLLVKNAATGARATVRIVDQCSFGGLALDPFVFNQLDTDGHGAVTGQLTVGYQFVDCQD